MGPHLSTGELDPMEAHLSTAQAVPTRGDWTSRCHGATPFECANSFVGAIPFDWATSSHGGTPFNWTSSSSDGHVSTKFSCNHIFTEHARFELEKLCDNWIRTRMTARYYVLLRILRECNTDKTTGACRCRQMLPSLGPFTANNNATYICWK